MNLHSEIVNHIRGFYKPPTFRLEDFKNSLNIFSIKETRIAFIKSIYDDLELKHQILKESYFHQNGFGKIVISNNYDQQWRLRLHIWLNKFNENIEFDDYDLHNHTWDFVSTILYGKFRNEFYQETSTEGEGIEYYKHIYSIPLETNVSNLKLIGIRPMICTEVQELIQGESYFQERDKIHRAFPINNDNAVTLIVQQIGKGVSSDVYKRRILEYDNSKGLTGNFLSISELDYYLKLILNWMESS